MTALYPPQRLRLLENAPPNQLLIHEIYQSVQGESTFAGLPCVFVRTSVCGQRCSWCDTPHAFTEGHWQTPETVLAAVLQFGCPLVEFTGGEPLLQPAVHPLMTELANRGCTVLLETGGAENVAMVDPRVHIIMDLKCPDSNECDRNNFGNLAHLKPTDQIKFVLASRRDFDWMVQTINEHQLDQRFIVLMSAVFGAIPLDELVQWQLSSRLNIRFQLQMHKIIWDPKKRGV